MTPEIEQDNRDARKERERALARERQRRRRSRASHAVTVRDGHAVTETVTPLTEPAPLPGARRLARVAQAIAQGVPVNTALRQQGYPQSRQVESAARALLKAEIDRAAIGVAQVVDSVAQGMAATSPMLTAEGCIERPDWTARAAGRRDAIALLDRAGELPAAQEREGGGSGVTVIYRPVVIGTLDIVDGRDATPPVEIAAP